jgi:protein-tyrosine phosphatase
MVDLHCHILPGIDDGARDLEASLAMARRAVEDGIDVIVATPHWPYESEPTPAARILELTSELQDELDRAQIPLHLVPGHECVITPELPDELASGGALAFGNGKARYALLETPYHHLPYYLRDIVFQVQSRGFASIIAHPERNPIIQNEPEQLLEYVRSGCLVQVTAGSLTGQWGAASRKTGLALFRRGLAHIIASDAHSANSRPPVLSDARKIVAEAIGEEIARKAVEDIPRKVIEGQPVYVPDPDDVSPPTRRGGLLARLFGR